MIVIISNTVSSCNAEEWKFDDSIDTFVAYKRYIASSSATTIFAYLTVNLSGYETNEEEWECVRICVSNAPIPYDITKKKIQFLS